MFKHVLVAVDGSESGQAAYDTATELAKELRASLTALHVVEPAARKGKALSAEALIEACRQRNSRSGIEPEVIIREGSASQEIQDAIATMRWDVLVIGTHGRQGVPRALLGSVAEDILRRTEIPVLVVRKPSRN